MVLFIIIVALFLFGLVGSVYSTYKYSKKNERDFSENWRNEYD